MMSNPPSNSFTYTKNKWRNALQKRMVVVQGRLVQDKEKREKKKRKG